MQTKEFYCQREFLLESFLFPAPTDNKHKNANSRTYKLHCFLLKKVFGAKKVAIDYGKKIAFLQYNHTSPIEDDRVHTAHSRIVEVHYHNLKTLFIALLKGNSI